MQKKWTFLSATVLPYLMILILLQYQRSIQVTAIIIPDLKSSNACSRSSCTLPMNMCVNITSRHTSLTDHRGCFVLENLQELDLMPNHQL